MAYQRHSVIFSTFPAPPRTIIAIHDQSESIMTYQKHSLILNTFPAPSLRRVEKFKILQRNIFRVGKDEYVFGGLNKNC